MIQHQHFCPQCEMVWDCWSAEADHVTTPLSEAFCYNGPLCHIKWGETVENHTIPKRRRKCPGDGALFHETRD